MERGSGEGRSRNFWCRGRRRKKRLKPEGEGRKEISSLPFRQRGKGKQYPEKGASAYLLKFGRKREKKEEDAKGNHSLFGGGEKKKKKGGKPSHFSRDKEDDFGKRAGGRSPTKKKASPVFWPGGKEGSQIIAWREGKKREKYDSQEGETN